MSALTSSREGINSLSVIWSTAVSAGLTSAAISNAQVQVTKNVNALASQMRSINTNAAVFTYVKLCSLLPAISLTRSAALAAKSTAQTT